MARERRSAAGSWLEGPVFTSDQPRGVRLGLPAEGPGSLASPGARLLAFVVDAVVANLLAGVPYLFGVHYGPGVRGYVVYAAFLLQEFVLDSVAGATIGKQLCGIRVISSDGGRLAWPWALARTVLLGFLIPAIIWDRDGRGLHDRATGALTIRAGRPAPVSAPASPPASVPGVRPPARSSKPARTGRSGGSVAGRRKRR